MMLVRQFVIVLFFMVGYFVVKGGGYFSLNSNKNLYISASNEKLKLHVRSGCQTGVQNLENIEADSPPEEDARFLHRNRVHPPYEPL